jgi:hypothetical protein
LAAVARCDLDLRPTASHPLPMEDHMTSVTAKQGVDGIIDVYEDVEKRTREDHVKSVERAWFEDVAALEAARRPQASRRFKNLV